MNRLFVFFCCLCGFLVAAEYGITRPPSNALFLTVFSSQAIPWAWMAAIPVNFLAVYLYSRFLPRLGPLKMVGSVIGLSILINTSTALFVHDLPWLIFLQYVWKDIYILLMFKQFWSMIHSTISADKAKYLYGFIFFMGTVGAIFGNALPSFFAVKMGSESLFFFTLPVYLLFFFFYRKAYLLSPLKEGPFSAVLSSNLGAKEGVSMVLRSRTLFSMLLLVILMQMSIGLVEYRFNVRFEAEVLLKDLRTEYMGRLIGLMNILSGFFQCMGSFFMVRLLGMKGSHFAIPLFLIASTAASLIFPSFFMISASYALLKALDFSLFGVLREMLYIPLKVDEKFRAKAVIDVFAHRTSKSLVSFCILGLQAIVSAAFLSPVVGFFSLALLVAWVFVVSFLFRKDPLTA